MGIKRNDPCLCGSGKKYKKCCLLKESVFELRALKEYRFDELKQQMMLNLRAFLSTKLTFDEENILKETFKKRLNANLSNESMMSYVTFWLLFFHEFANGYRGVEWFYNEVGRSLSKEEKDLLENWIELVPKVIKTINYNDEGKFIMDLFTHETFFMPYSENVKNVRPWEISFCLLEPFNDGYYINGVSTWTGPEVAETLITEIHRLLSSTNKTYEQVVRDFYPELLSIVIGENGNFSTKSCDVTNQVLTYQVKNKDKVVEQLLKNKAFEIDEWEEDKGNGKMVWVGEWYCYEDSELEDPIYLSKSYGQLVVNNNEITITGFSKEKVNEFENWLEQYKNDITLTKRDEIVYRIPNSDQYVSYYNILSENTPQHFAFYAQTRLRWFDLNKPFMGPNSLSPREMKVRGKIEELEALLQKFEYHSFLTLKGAAPQTEDFNWIRNELGLPVSPFVTNYETRKTSIKVWNQTSGDGNILESDLPYFEQLGLTINSAMKFYGHDILKFFKEKTEGKSKATISKYETGLKILVAYFDVCDEEISCWSDCTEGFWEKLIAYSYLDLNIDANNSQAKALFATIYTFARHIDNTYNTRLASVVKALNQYYEEPIIQAIAFLSCYNDYYQRKYHTDKDQLDHLKHTAVSGYNASISGLFEVVGNSSSNLTLISLDSDLMDKHKINLSAKESKLVHTGMLLKGTIGKKVNDNWEIVSLERVYPQSAKDYMTIEDEQSVIV